jgi:serine phosphatase RsbU (regulator of sigma subunit)
MAGSPPDPTDELYEALNDLALLAVSGVRGCDAAGISVLDAGTVTTAAATSADALKVDDAQYRRGDGPCLSAIRDGTVISVGDMAADRRWPLVAAEAVEVGVGSSLSVPLLDGGQVMGALNLYAAVPHAFDTPSQLAAEALARQGAITMRYLQLLHRERADRLAERGVAETLQRSLLPTLPQLDGLSCASRYLPAASGVKVGGDWYDVFALPDGAVGIAVGDVMGHDVAAAAAMGQLRSVLRSYAYEGSSPATVLDRMDRLVRGFDMAYVATAVYARLVLDHAGAMMLFANAGHPPPLVQHPDGSVRRLAGAASRVVGVSLTESRPRSEAAVELPAGSTLLLYTDGLIEAGNRDRDEGIDQLDAVVGAHDPTDGPDILCQRVLDAMVTAERADDIALLAIHLGDG